MSMLVTGGAGFVGSSLAMRLKQQQPAARIVAFDNLHRRGSELVLDRLVRGGVEFVHGDVRSLDDLDQVGPFDALIECSAESSVHAGYAASPSYVLHTNLVGTINCLEAARRHRADVLFLSTSRVYPIQRLRNLPLEQRGMRLEIPASARGEGWSADGITTEFPLRGHRSIYGATKLASELLIEEYRYAYGLRAIVNRCGVIAGPWQMGKVDQGFVALWAAAHLWGEGLTYCGFGGHGAQVRDLLHIDDLARLVSTQLGAMERFDGAVYNVGGGQTISVSLSELTAHCQRRAGRAIRIDHVEETAPADVPFYVTDNAEVTAATGWAPQLGVEALLDDVFAWLEDQESTVRPVLEAGARSVVGARRRTTAWQSS